MRFSRVFVDAMLSLLLIACAGNSVSTHKSRADTAVCNDKNHVLHEQSLSNEELYGTWGDRFAPEEIPGASKTHIFFLAKDHTGFENITAVMSGKERLNTIQFFTWQIDENTQEIKQEIIKTMRMSQLPGEEKTVEIVDEKNRIDTATAKIIIFKECNGEESHMLQLMVQNRPKMLIRVAVDEAPSALPYMETWKKMQEQK